MAKYEIEIKKSAVKEIKKLPKKDLKRVLAIVSSLATNPRPRSAKKLSAQEKYRIRSGNYRVLYAIEDAVLVVYIVKIAHRKDAYRK